MAKYEIEKEAWEIIYKLGGKFFKSKQNHSPFDVVAWHGNYVPYKYDLTKFVNVGSISGAYYLSLFLSIIRTDLI